MRFIVRLSLLGFLIFVGCQKRDESTKREEASTNKENKSVERKVEHKTVLQDQDVVRSVALSFDKIEGQHGIISASKLAFQDFDHPQLSQKMGEDALKEALNDPRSLSESLKDENSHWNANPSLKKSVIGIASLLTGLIGIPDEETVAGLPDLFINQDHETQRDMLMIQIAKQAVRVAESQKMINAEAFEKWLAMTQSSNEITRYTALILFDLVAPTKEQAQRFFNAYSNEKNQIIVDLTEVESKKIPFLE